MKDLTVSAIDRQNILNNNSAVENIQKFLGIEGMLFNGQYLFTTKMVADFYKIDIKTVKRYVSNSELEIKHNGYEVLKGQKLKDFKEQFGYFITKADDPEQTETDFPLLSETLDNQAKSRLKALAVFNFRSFLNLGMLLTESEKAKALRSAILDIVIDTLNQKMGGSTKYINQRDEDFLVSIAREPLYRKEFTQALNQYLAMGNYKYAVYTDAIYTAIFDGKAKKYKQTLQLSEAENPRDTMYAEIINLISSFEIGIADAMKNKSEQLGRKLMPLELDILIQDFASQRFWLPQITDARTKMASRDYAFRDIVHKRLEPYISSLSPNDYDRFLGDKSKSLIERVLENPALLDVFKRLKDR